MSAFSTRFAAALDSAMSTEVGLTQEMIAAEAGVSQSTVSRWLTGNMEPSREALQRLASSRRVGALINTTCSNAIIPASPSNTLAELDADGDGDITAQDLQIHHSLALVHGANIGLTLLQALRDGRISPSERAELERLQIDQETTAKRARTVLSLVAR